MAASPGGTGCTPGYSCARVGWPQTLPEPPCNRERACERMSERATREREREMHRESQCYVHSSKQYRTQQRRWRHHKQQQSLSPFLAPCTVWASCTRGCLWPWGPCSRTPQLRFPVRTRAPPRGTCGHCSDECAQTRTAPPCPRTLGKKNNNNTKKFGVEVLRC